MSAYYFFRRPAIISQKPMNQPPPPIGARVCDPQPCSPAKPCPRTTNPVRRPDHPTAVHRTALRPHHPHPSPMWSAATCRRFELGDMSPSPQAQSCLRTPHCRRHTHTLRLPSAASSVIGCWAWWPSARTVGCFPNFDLIINPPPSLNL